MIDTKDFCWSDIAEDVVIPDQPAIAIYTNPNGAIVLRQAGQYGVEDDHWLYFHPQHAADIAYAILNAAGHETAEINLEKDNPQPKDKTGAERQKRYRARKKHDGDSVTPVTRNTHEDRDELPLRNGNVTEFSSHG